MIPRWWHDHVVKGVVVAEAAGTLAEDQRVEAWWRASLTLADLAWLNAIGVQP